VATHCAALVLVLMGSRSSTYISLLSLTTACCAYFMGLYYLRVGSLTNRTVRRRTQVTTMWWNLKSVLALEEVRRPYTADLEQIFVLKSDGWGVV